MKQNSNIMPALVQQLGTNKGYLINFNIEQVTNEMEENTQVSYNYDSVHVQTLNRAEVISAIVRTRYTQDQEFALQRKAIAQEPGAQAEFEEYNTFVNAAKAIADEVIEEEMQ